MHRLLEYGHRIWTDLIALCLTLVMIFIVLAQFYVRPPVSDDTTYNMASGWLTTDGQTVALNEVPPDTITLTHTLAGMCLQDKRLCLKSSDTFITISADGETLYEYAPVYAPLIGKSYGNYVHTVTIPPEAQTLEMTLTPVYEGDTADIRYAHLEDPADFIVNLYRQGLPEFIACLIMIVFGIIMMLLEITGGSVSTGQPMGFLPLGVFSAIIGIWSMNDTYILQNLTQRPELIKILCYFCIMLIAYPPVSFVATAAKRRESPLLPALAGLIVLNFLTTLVLSGTGLVDPHYMLLFSHLNIVVAMGITIYLMVQATRTHRIERQFLATILIGMTAALLGVGIDLLRFWFVKNSEYGSSPFTRVGVLIFIVAEGIYLLREKNRLLVEQGNAALMKRMAYSDALTTLPNRAAYYEKEESLRRNGHRCTFVLLDINWLKRVNDEYGHAAGDRHIIAAAKIIQACLSDYGTCYRTGGDEFAAILDTDDARITEQAFKQLEQAEKAYNAEETPPVPLQLAYGYAIYVPETMSLEAAENLADQRMYEMKRMMKAVR